MCANWLLGVGLYTSWSIVNKLVFVWVSLCMKWPDPIPQIVYHLVFVRIDPILQFSTKIANLKLTCNYISKTFYTRQNLHSQFNWQGCQQAFDIWEVKKIEIFRERGVLTNVFDLRLKISPRLLTFSFFLIKPDKKTTTTRTTNKKHSFEKQIYYLK